MEELDDDDLPLCEMKLPQLRRRRQRAKLDLANIKVGMRGTATKYRMELEEAAQEAREYIDIIEARIARLERVGRN